MRIGERSLGKRKHAGASLLSLVGLRVKGKQAGVVRLGHLAGFDVSDDVCRHGCDDYRGRVVLKLGGEDLEFEITSDTGPLGIVARLENALEGLEQCQVEQGQMLAVAEKRLPGYEQWSGGAFGFVEDLALKEAELAALEASLKATKAANDDEVKEAQAAWR